MGKGGWTQVWVGVMEQCYMGRKYAKHARSLFWSLHVMSSFFCRAEEKKNPRPRLTQPCVCVCACEWVSELLDFQHVELQVWKLGVRFMCDELPTCGLIGATPPFPPPTFFSFPFSSFYSERKHISPTAWVNLGECKYWKIQGSNFKPLLLEAPFLLHTASTSAVVCSLIGYCHKFVGNMSCLRHLQRFTWDTVATVLL